MNSFSFTIFLALVATVTSQTRPAGRATTQWAFKGCLSTAPDDFKRAVITCKSTGGSTSNVDTSSLTEREKMMACVMQELKMYTDNGINFDRVNKRFTALRMENESKAKMRDGLANCISGVPKDKKANVQVPIFVRCLNKVISEVCPEFTRSS